MKVTCAVVVLISLLFFCDLAFSAPNCGANGVQDSYATSYCNCFSGYAPSDSTQSDCSVSDMCPLHEPIDTSTRIGGYPPFLYNATFKADRYNAVVRVPLVVGRRNSTVRFVGGSNTCGYPGNLWTKKANSLACIDELWGSLPWTSNGMCGFTGAVSGAKTMYSAKMVVSYDDYIQDGGFIRTSAVLLNVNVTFVTQTSVIFSLVNLTPGSQYLQVSVVGSVIYDANTGLASVSIRTTASWPYEVQTISMFTTPLPNTAIIATDLFYDTSAVCTNVSKSSCLQQYVMSITPNGGCNLGGNYVFNITLFCRANACGGTLNSGSYSVLIYDTDICGAGGIDTSLANGALLPYSDAAGNTPASNFNPNQMVYFAFTVTSDDVTISAVTVETISVADSAGDSDVLYNANVAGTTAYVTAEGSEASLSITPAITPAPAGTPVTLWFSLQLVDAIASFRVIESQATAVTVTIVVDLTFQGSSKRQVAVSSSVTSSQGLADIYISDATGDNLASMENSSNTLSPIAPLLLSIFALVFMIALRR